MVPQWGHPGKVGHHHKLSCNTLVIVTILWFVTPVELRGRIGPQLTPVVRQRQQTGRTDTLIFCFSLWRSIALDAVTAIHPQSPTHFYYQCQYSVLVGQCTWVSWISQPSRCQNVVPKPWIYPLSLWRWVQMSSLGIKRSITQWTNHPRGPYILHVIVSVGLLIPWSNLLIKTSIMFYLRISVDQDSNTVLLDTFFTIVD